MPDLTMSMKVPVQRLRALSQHFPQRDPMLYQFGSFLADRIESRHEELAPEGFVVVGQQTLYDLKQGVDGLTNRRIDHPLARQPDHIYPQLRGALPGIADAVFAQEFASAIRFVLWRVDKEVQKPQ